METANWPPEHSAALRDLRARGMSYADITRTINARFRTSYSRNATLGRAQRLGLGAPIEGEPPRRWSNLAKPPSRNNRRNRWHLRRRP